ncbi:MAG: glycosyltransferase family 2 protein [Bdellovibrio sp.]|nr:glycosyltransferase family 2 protein [Bdellovibrio sp.]
MNTPLSISVIVPTLGKSSVLHALLKSLSEQKTEAPFEVLLIDNSQDPEVAKNLKSVCSVFSLNLKQIVIESKGVNEARNVGIKESQSNLLLFIDDDSWLNDRYLLQKHIQLHLKNENYFAIGGNYVLEKDAGFLDQCYQDIQMRWLYQGVVNLESNQSKYLIGGHFSAKKELLTRFSLQFDPVIKYGGSELSLFNQAFKQNLFMRLENLSLVHVPHVSLKGLIKKLYKQGQGKAYLNDDDGSSSQHSALVEGVSLAKRSFLYFLNLVFWFGFYQQKNKGLLIIRHIFKDFFGNIQLKRFQTLKKIEDQLEQKKNRGDRL